VEEGFDGRPLVLLFRMRAPAIREAATTMAAMSTITTVLVRPGLCVVCEYGCRPYTG
jgi:hypothetical protein